MREELNQRNNEQNEQTSRFSKALEMLMTGIRQTSEAVMTLEQRVTASSSYEAQLAPVATPIEPEPSAR